MKLLNRAIAAALSLLFIFMLNASVVQAEAASSPSPVAFTAEDLAGGQACVLESVFGYWGFEYYPADGKWTAEDVYELTLFQRWAAVKPTGKYDEATKQAVQSTYLIYGSDCIPRQKLPLEGRFIGINPGHQQKANYQREFLSPERGSPKKIKVSSGTQGVSTRVPEYAVNLSVGLKLRNRLEAMGARVLMTRTVNAVNISNAERSRMMNKAGVEVYLSLHCDGNRNRRISGLHTLIPAYRGYQTRYVQARSRKLGLIMQAEAIKSTRAVNRGVGARRDLTGFNWTKMPTCLVEMGYMSNSAEDKRLKTSAYQDKLAFGMARAFVRYFNEVG